MYMLGQQSVKRTKYFCLKGVEVIIKKIDKQIKA